MHNTINDWANLRLEKLCRRAVAETGLDLSGLTVCTEAASGNFVITPLIAAIAGAEKVVCLGRDSPFGTFKAVSESLCRTALDWHLPVPIVTDNRRAEVLQGLDIVTNLGMLRPLDAELLTWIGGQSVVPYMCEAWEVRPQDVDFDVCRNLGIPVMATDEDAPGIDVFSHSGMLAVKMLFDANLEVVGNRIAVLGSDKFGPVIMSAINRVGGQALLYTSSDGYSGVEDGAWDAVVIAEYVLRQAVLGCDGAITGERFQKLVKGSPAIIQFAGQNNVDELRDAGCRVYPEMHLPPVRMAKTLADLGPWSAILLHAAGLVVGEKMARAKRNGLTGAELEKFVLENAPAQLIG